jgi:hypothetical protein
VISESRPGLSFMLKLRSLSFVAFAITHLRMGFYYHCKVKAGLVNRSSGQSNPLQPVSSACLLDFGYSLQSRGTLYLLMPLFRTWPLCPTIGKFLK